MTIFFTSDTHFGDHRTINIHRRPFGSVAEMDAALVEGWNSIVADEDEVWHLGDFARSRAAAALVLPQLKGRKHLLRGNNDPEDVLSLSEWQTVRDYAELRFEGRLLVLCHYPFRSWNKQHRKALNLHGHAHGRLKPLPRQIDIGVDAWGFRPASIHELLLHADAKSRASGR